MNKPDAMWQVLKVLPTDYTDYGGTVERWSDPEGDYPDCSCGCRYFKLSDGDWGVCVNPEGPRAGLLTWEHQAGVNCFEGDGEE